MKKELRRRCGMVLLTTLIVTALVLMFIGAAILVGPRNLGLARSQDGELAAKAAAESGIQYALMRIRENPEWRGEGHGLVLSSDELSVVENSGYVWGQVKLDEGKFSVFRIRFNYENGPGGFDGLDDSTGPRISIPWVSVNNVSNSSKAVVPRASSDSSSVVLDATQGEYEVPAHGLCLLVEGLSGPGLARFDPDEPNPRGVIHSKVVESIFVVSGLGTLSNDAVAMSNSDLLVRVQDGNSLEVDAKAAKTPQIRSRGEVTVEQQDGTVGRYSSKGKVYTRDATLNADYELADVTVETEDNTAPFYEVAWDDLKTADPSGPKLAAGTYVWWDDGSLHYYDLDYSDYESWIKLPANTSDPGQLVFSSGAYVSGFDPPPSLTISNNKLQVSGDLYIAPVSKSSGDTVSDLAIIPREGALESPPGAAASTAGPALAQYLANNPAALQAFLNGRTGDGTAGSAEGWDSASPPGVTNGADIGWNLDGSNAWYDPADYSSWEQALTDAFSDGYVTSGELSSTAASYGLVESNGDLNLQTGDTTTAEDIEVEFQPAPGQSATLSAEGNVRIGAQLQGDGASITSGESIRVIGAGADLSANPNAEEGVNLYARRDITLSTLKKTAQDQYEFKDIQLKGLVYTWGDFEAKLGSEDPDTPWGKMNLEGALVAFGGNPANGSPTRRTKGSVTITALEVGLSFDPAYLLGLLKTLPRNLSFERRVWAAY